MYFSIIIPLYNRPQEIKELLQSLTLQNYSHFEVLVVEDGSTVRAKDIVESFAAQLNIKYYFKENAGQGFARNYGFERAKGDYFICFDSDCIIPENYLQIVENTLRQNYLDAFGGPDAAHASFSPLQKAISYAMTSTFTTGGIRGKNKNAGGQYHPRSFNMGISRKVWETTGGFAKANMGEDIEFSIRIAQANFKIALIKDAKVYHKRRTSFLQFWKQVFSFGKTRIDLYLRHPNTLKLVHLLPAAFTVFCFLLVLLNIFIPQLGIIFNAILIIYILLIFFDSLFKNKQINIAFLSLIASFIQLMAYGLGFIQDFIRKIIFKNNK